jgi:ribosomal protein S18 acetylase RimI-like enzyme
VRIAMKNLARVPRRVPVAIRRARRSDVAALVTLEERCFASDRLSRRNFLRLLRTGHCICLVAERAGAVAGYGLVLLHGATALAHLYSIAVDPRRQGEGIGTALLAACEEEARSAGRAILRLEVRPDNEPAIRRYRAAGYREIGRYPDYYEDHSDALRMEKQLAGGVLQSLNEVEFFAQSLDFTCGPASLMRAMHALDPATALDRSRELRLWREATLIFTTSGHGGCGPHGLALAARRRGFRAEVFVSDDGVPFVDSVRSSEKREVMRLVHEDFQRQCGEAGIPVHIYSLSADELGERIAADAIPIVLISLYRIHGQKTPHWVVVTATDERFIYIHDPFVDVKNNRTPGDCMNLPIARSEFDRMARYGGARLRATVLVSRPAGKPRRR